MAGASSWKQGQGLALGAGQEGGRGGHRAGGLGLETVPVPSRMQNRAGAPMLGMDGEPVGIHIPSASCPTCLRYAALRACGL